MKIRLSDLPPQGLPVTGELAVASLNARLQEGRGCDIEFTVPPQISLLALPNSGGAEIRGTITSSYRQGCGRCLEPVTRELNSPIQFTVKQRPEPMPGDNPADEFIDDAGIIYFDGDHLELEATLQDSLMLQLQLFWSPEICDGRCSHCDKEIDPRPITIGGSSKLGDLLAQAAKKAR